MEFVYFRHWRDGSMGRVHDVLNSHMGRLPTASNSPSGESHALFWTPLALACMWCIQLMQINTHTGFFFLFKKEIFKRIYIHTAYYWDSQKFVTIGIFM